MVAVKFQIYSVKITTNTFVSQKLNLFIFTHALKRNSPPGFYHYPPGRWELPVPNGQRFLKTSRGERGGEDYKVEKNTKINRGMGLKF